MKYRVAFSLRDVPGPIYKTELLSWDEADTFSSTKVVYLHWLEDQNGEIV